MTLMLDAAPEVVTESAVELLPELAVIEVNVPVLPEIVPPEIFAEIVPAIKFPEESLATIVEAVLALVAFVLMLIVPAP
jgi:hypothetical protein